MLDLLFTFQVLFMIVISIWVITAWDRVLDKAFLTVLGLDENDIVSWIIIGCISTIIFILILIGFGIEAHDLFGVAEIVDAQLTGHPEVLEGVKVITL